MNRVSIAVFLATLVMWQILALFAEEDVAIPAPMETIAAENPGAIRQADPLPEGAEGPSEAAAPAGASASAPAQPPVTPYLLLLESDWSKSPTAGEVKADLEKALATVKIPEALRRDVLQSGPNILFSENNVSLYQPQTCAELMAWLEKHKLVRKQIPFPTMHAVVDPRQHRVHPTAVPTAPDGFETTYVDEENLIPFLKLEDAAGRPFVEWKQQGKWQFYVHRAGTYVEWSAALQQTPFVLGEPNAEEARPQMIIEGRLQRRPDEAVFASARIPESGWFPYPSVSAPIAPASSSDLENAAGSEKSDVAAQLDARRRAVYPVIWLRPDLLPNPGEAAPVLHIPDRVALPNSVRGNVPQRVTIPFDQVKPSKPATTDSASPPGATAIQPSSQQDAPKDPGSLKPVTDQPAVRATVSQSPASEQPSLPALRQEYQRLDAATAALAEELRRNSPEEIAARRNELRKAVQAAFRAGQRLHQAELEEFRQRMDGLQSTIDQRTRNADKVVERRVDDLLHLNLGWDTTPAGTASSAESTNSRTDAKSSASELQGVWKLLSAPHVSGSAQNSNLQLVISRDQCGAFESGRLSRMYDVVVDTSREPRTIRLQGRGGISSSSGVYRIHGTVLRMNLAIEPEPSPVDFTGTPFQFELVSREVPMNLIDAMSTGNSVTGVHLPQVDDLGAIDPFGPSVSIDSTVATPRKRRMRKPFAGSVTVGVISGFSEDGREVIISCKEPGEIEIGEELFLIDNNLAVEANPEHVLGWIVVTRLDAPETAIGRPIELTRVLSADRKSFLDRKPQAGDGLKRAIYHVLTPSGSNRDAKF